jgi:hypothetical protein
MAGTCSNTLGNSKTNSYIFGASEMRIGVLSDVLKLTSANSIGVLNSVEINFAREFADLRGGRANQMLAKGLSQTDLTVTATGSEATIRNMALMAGQGIQEPVFTANSTATAPQVATDTEVTTAVDMGLVAGDYLSIVDCDNSGAVQIVKVASAAALVVTLDATTPLILAVKAGDIVNKMEFVAMTAPCAENYLTCQILLDSVDSLVPRQFLGFYGLITSSLAYSQSSSDFGEYSMEMSFFQVPSSFTASGGDLERAADLIALNGLGTITSNQ